MLGPHPSLPAIDRPSIQITLRPPAFLLPIHDQRPTIYNMTNFWVCRWTMKRQDTSRRRTHWHFSFFSLMNTSFTPFSLSQSWWSTISIHYRAHPAPRHPLHTILIQFYSVHLSSSFLYPTCLLLTVYIYRIPIPTYFHNLSSTIILSLCCVSAIRFHVRSPPLDLSCSLLLWLVFLLNLVKRGGL